MTTTRYFIARLGQAFGIFRRNQRMGEAASEMHLLREAEAELGMAVWEKVDSIERLTIEYWNLRKFAKDREAVLAQLAVCEQRLDATQKARAELLNAASTPQTELYDQRLAIIASLEELTRERDKIVIKARDIRRIHDGLKIKIEVLTKEQAPSPERDAQLEKVKQRLAELKQEFVNLKEQRSAVGAKIEAGDNQLDQLVLTLESFKNERRVEASETFKVIGDTNKEISTLRAELGLLDTRIRQLHGEIGRYVSRQSLHDKRCAETVQAHRGLVDVMRALRRSVALNHRLGDRS